MSRIERMLACAIALALSMLMSGAAYALPSIENLRFTYDSNANGVPVCGTERLTFNYGANPNGDAAWGVRVIRNGRVMNNTTVLNWGLFGPQTLSTAAIGGSIVSNLTYSYQLVTYNQSGVGEYSTAVNAILPACDGSANDGVGYLIAAHVLVSFSDFAQLLPFTEQEYATRLLEVNTADGGRISLSRYFQINSHEKVGVKNTIHPWIALPHPMAYYCTNTLYQAAYRGLTLGYGCDTWAIQRDAIAALAQQGVTLNATVKNFIVNGMGATGFGGGGATALSADGMRYSMNHPEQGLAFDALAHEMGHAIGLGHANSLSQCANGTSPSNFDSILPSNFRNGTLSVDCRVVRYGTSMMGGSTIYDGFSGAHRYKVGFLDEAHIARGDLPNSMTVQLADLDTVTSRKNLILLNSAWLPQHQIFIEYSKELSALSGTTLTNLPGVRVGLMYKGVALDDGDVLYLDDIRLQAVNDRVALPALDLAIRLVSKDADSVELYVSPIDATPPSIFSANVKVTPVNKVLFTWLLNEPASVYVEYGTTTDYGSSTLPTTASLQTLSGLPDGRTYHYRLVATDHAGNIYRSPDRTFALRDLTPPSLISLSANVTSNNRVLFAWLLTEPASVVIEYGVTQEYGSATPATTSTVQLLNGTMPSTTYHYCLVATDSAGNVYRSVDRTFTSRAIGF